jgi:surface polysaccharide O-acyltransferase-like enzyme
MTVAPAMPLTRSPARVIAQEHSLRSERARGREEPRRWAWMDNLRVVVIAGVIVEHVATAYVLDIDWYYEERSSSAMTEVIVGAAILPAALFAMAVLFLVAGLLSARSLARKGPSPFVRDRLLRLGAPLVAFSFVIGPLTSLVGQRAEGNPGADDVGSFLIEKMQDADTGPMWFVTALLVFSIAYGSWRGARPAGLTASGPLRRGHLVAAAAAIVVGSFVVRLKWPFTADTPSDLNLWEWPQMATLFTLGVVAGERGWLDPIPDRLRRACGRASIIGALGLLVVVAAVGLAGDEDPFLGGWHLQALAEPMTEATMAVAMSFWLVGWFARRWTYQGTLARSLGRASFAAYIVHPPVLVLLSAGLSSLTVAAEVKFVVVAVLGVATSFTVGWYMTKMRPLARVL